MTDLTRRALTSRTAGDLAPAIAAGGWLANGVLLALAAATILGHDGQLDATPVLAALLALGLVSVATAGLWYVIRFANRSAWRSVYGDRSANSPTNVPRTGESEPTIAPMTEQTSDLPPTTPPPTKPRGPRWLWWALGAVVAGAVVIILATIAVNGQPEPAAVQSSPPAAATADAPTPEPQPTAEPAPADFVLSVTTLEKTCFGSAGCNVTFRLMPGYVGPGLTDAQEFTVVYEVAGGEGGPQINSFTMRGTRIEYDSEESLQTTSPKAVLTAKVTEVLAN